MSTDGRKSAKVAPLVPDVAAPPGGAAPAGRAVPPPGGASRRVRLVVRFSIGAGLLILLARETSWREVADVLGRARPGWLAVSMAVSLLLTGIGAWKWRILLQARSCDPGGWSCLRLYLVGCFYNNVLPTGIGGDVVRAGLLGRRSGRLADAVASVFAERFTGLTVLVGMALAVLPWCDALSRASALRAVALVLPAYVGLLWAVCDPRAARLVRACCPGRLGTKILSLREAIAVYRGESGAIARCLGLSVVFHVVAAINVQVSVAAFGGGLGFGEALVATPIILAVAMAPISIAGIGVAEWAYVTALGAADIPPAAALSAALLIRAKSVLIGLAGGPAGAGAATASLSAPSVPAVPAPHPAKTGPAAATEGA